MGSLNSNGTRITQSRESLRKIGRGHTKSADRLESATFVGPTPAALSSQLGTMPDREITQRSILQQGRYIRTTQSLEDLTVESNSNLHDVVASEQPEMQNLDETRKSSSHTGNRILISDSNSTGTVESRKEN